MSRHKYGYEDFRYDDLTGGINIRDYPSEIENKQSLELENWNFEGNRLVSEKGWTDSGNASKTRIGGMTIDSGDIWTVSDGAIYENGTQIVDGTGILVTTNSDTFKSGVNFYITIEGDDYSISGDTVAEFIENIKAETEANGLITTSQEDIILIRKSNGNVIDYTVTTNQAYVLYNEDNTSLYEYGVTYPYSVNINGIDYESFYTMSSEELNAGQIDEELMLELIDLIPTSLDPVFAYIDGDFEKVDDYTSYAGIIINKVTSLTEVQSTYYEYRLNNYSGSGFLLSTGVTINGTELKGPRLYRTHGFPTASINYDGFTATIGGNVLSLTGTLSSEDASESWKLQLQNAGYNAVIDDNGNDKDVYYWASDGGDISISNEVYVTGTYYYSYTRDIDMFGDQILTGNSYEYGINMVANFNRDVILSNLNSIAGITASEDTKDGLTGIFFSADNFDEIAVTTDSSGLTSATLDFTGSKIRKHTYDEVVPVVEELQVGDGLAGRANITIGNLGNLVVDKDDGGAFYAYDGINIKIGEDAIGEPTVGTIYNGKIILGGYEDNDNIIFSKTGSPTFPLNVLNFTDYSAGGQSVSGGDKGLITGMMVGENGLYVFKDNSIWYSNSEKDDSNSYSFNLIFNKITSNGALSQNTITEVEQEILYLDWNTRAVRRLGYEQNLTTLRDSSISREIANLFKDLPENQELATSHFKYPNYQLSLTDGTGEQITYNNGNTYYANNKHFIYNVENKSWTTKTGLDGVLASERGYFASSDGLVYEDFSGNTEQPGAHTSKEFTFIDEVDFKRYGELEVVGDITGDGGTKNLEIEISVDEELLDIGPPSDLYKRTVSAGDGETLRFRERVDLFDDGQRFIFKLSHNGSGYVEISDVNIKVKPIDVFHSNYY